MFFDGMFCLCRCDTDTLNIQLNSTLATHANTFERIDSSGNLALERSMERAMKLSAKLILYLLQYVFFASEQQLQNI